MADDWDENVNVIKRIVPRWKANMLKSKDTSNFIETFIIEFEKNGYPSTAVHMREILHKVVRPYQQRLDKAVLKLDVYGTKKAKENPQGPYGVQKKREEMKLIGSIINALNGYRVR